MLNKQQRVTTASLIAFSIVAILSFLLRASIGAAVFHYLDVALFVGFAIFRFYQLLILRDQLWPHLLDVTMLLPILSPYYGFIIAKIYILIVGLLEIFFVFSFVLETRFVARRFFSNPAKLVLYSFGGTIFLGTFLLMLPYATTQGIGFVDALFTATSAVCVTGLIVLDTVKDFTLFGQTIIMGLIQIGGLGIMTLSTSLVFIVRRQIGRRGGLIMQNVLEEADNSAFARLLQNILFFTFSIELIGAVFLFVHFYGLGFSLPKAAYYSLFHAVSAFCNAGFALFSDSFMGAKSSMIINFSIMGLIVTGGIGFTVMTDCLRLFREQKSWKLLRAHSKIALTTTFILIGFGFLVIFFTEFSHTMSNFSLQERFLASLFQSVTARTAGFNTIDFAHLAPGTQFLFLILMFIGASPGSTGGGIKTTTFAVTILTILAIMRGRQEVEAFGRRIPFHTIQKSLAIIAISFSCLLLGIFGLLLIEPFSFADLSFEAVSAFATVGLSTGVTAALTSWGKAIIILLMFIGRVGPLTMAIAFKQEERKGNYRFPEGKIVVG